jgi:hypothetical protein
VFIGLIIHQIIGMTGEAMRVRGIVMDWIVGAKMREPVVHSIQTTRAISGVETTSTGRDSDGAMRKAIGSTLAAAGGSSLIVPQAVQPAAREFGYFC